MYLFTGCRTPSNLGHSESNFSRSFYDVIGFRRRRDSHFVAGRFPPQPRHLRRVRLPRIGADQSGSFRRMEVAGSKPLKQLFPKHWTLGSSMFPNQFDSSFKNKFNVSTRFEYFE